jgi:hypothetical protein
MREIDGRIKHRNVRKRLTLAATRNRSLNCGI